MIIVELFGGLGNQMFQYAAGRRLAHFRKTELKLNISEFESYNSRSYSLNIFNLQEEKFATLVEISRLLYGKRSLLKRAISKIQHMRPKLLSTYIKERYFSFDPAILNLPDGIYLDGYWQSEKYFKDIEEIIRREFTIKVPQTGNNKELSKIIQSCESVSIHIRRGDYISDSDVNKKHGECELSYYFNCIQMINGKIKKPTFFVFSDDCKWVHENFRLNYPMVIVDQNDSEHAYEDMRLMSQCKHNIIANSTFSWWAAWLNPNPDKMVFSPRKWFKTEELDDRDLIPETWLKI